MDRSVKIKQLETQPKGRTIAISDIHADYDGYTSLLDKIGYQKNVDRLVIVGDFIEKGVQNLKLLHTLMDQVENEDVHVLMGNCDFTCKNVLYSYRLEFLRFVLLTRKNSLIHEMADQIGISFDEQTDIEWYCQQIRKHYLKELSFCNDLPHVLETPDTLYAHAALPSANDYGSDFKDVINASFFLDHADYFPKRLVVGHMPVTEYCHDIARFDPIYDAKHNVYSIDGGNIVKKHSGQLNALIFDKDKVEVDCVQRWPLVQVIKDVNPDNPLPLFVTWNERKVEILETHQKQTLVYNKKLGRKFYVENEFIHNGTASEYTNYQMPLKKGEWVYIIFEYGDKVQIKRNGILGWTYRSNLDL